MASIKSFKSGSRFSNIAAIVIIAGAILAGLQRQAIYDWWQLHNYSAPAEISQLAAQTTMTDKARHLFYINHPNLESKSTFTTHCPSGTEQSVVLGCYKSTQRGIYLLRVTNQELSGIQQVTTAHEMLHAAYDRLSANDQAKLNSMLTSYYKTGLTDETIRQTVDAYKKTEPNDVVNEMNSIFGTQVGNLPVGLETFYEQYFTDRSKVVSYYSKYQAAFTQRQRQVRAYDKQLSSLKKEIDQAENDVDRQRTTLDASRASLDAKRSDPAAYNAGVSNYNQQVSSYNAAVRSLKSTISEYNVIVQKRNDIALEEQQLVQAITSSPKLAQ